jgi:hypothetical protein
MPVIIKDFQVLGEEPRSQPQASAAAESQSQASPLAISLQGLEALLKYAKARRARVHAE